MLFVFVPHLQDFELALILVSTEYVPSFDWWQPLAGPKQTVPRAELTAVVLVARNAMTA